MMGAEAVQILLSMLIRKRDQIIKEELNTSGSEQKSKSFKKD